MDNTQNTLTLILSKLKSMNGRFDHLENDMHYVKNGVDELKGNMATLINANTTLSQENEGLQKQIDIHSADIVKLRAAK